MRPSWDEYFLEMLPIIGKRSTCDRGRCAALFVRNNRILATGYAGAPPGFPHCDHVGHDLVTVTDASGNTTTHCQRGVHAEVNCVAHAALVGTSLIGSTLYVTMVPCYRCTLVLLHLQLQRVMALYSYRAQQDNDIFMMFLQTGTDVKLVNQHVLYKE
jgi:dCMP deaminase